jgi:hypothetical protein
MSGTDLSVRVAFGNLWTYRSSHPQERIALRQLGDPSAHIHGLLVIEVHGERLPHLGFFGPDDVCIGEWTHQLQLAVRVLGAAPRSRFVFDEGGQGQPAFLFERGGGKLFVSIVDSALSDGKADPEWQRVECRFADFERSIDFFVRSLRRRLSEELSNIAEPWWVRNVERA